MKVEHIALYVNDLERARDFFVKYLEAESSELYQNPVNDFQSYFLSFSEGPRIELMHRPDMSDDQKKLRRTGYSHISFQLGSTEAVDALTKRLREDGFRVDSGPKTTGDGYYESRIIGVEGNQIELMA